jgi:hypothetical protein
LDNNAARPKTRCWKSKEVIEKIIAVELEAQQNHADVQERRMESS